MWPKAKADPRSGGSAGARAAADAAAVLSDFIEVNTKRCDGASLHENKTMLLILPHVYHALNP
jgi:hypothetical protein